MIKFNDVKNQSTEEYFNGNQFSIDAFNKKYTLNDKETYVEALKRVCDFVASVEKTNELQKYWSERWFDEIYEDWFHPAGSIMQGAGSGRKVSLANCTTTSLGSLRDDEEWDSLESIYKNAAYTVAKCAAHRQGLGLDFSRLRPKGSEILNSANISDGSIHWMNFIDSIGYHVGQKGRIPAMLFSLSIKHPDIEEFITIKSNKTKIQNANISVQITNNFYSAVENDDDWTCEFIIPAQKKGQKIYVDVHSTDLDCKNDERGWYYIAKMDKKNEVISKKYKARKLLELIAKNMYENAEPGIQNIDIARKYSNSDYVYDENDAYDSRILSTNACSEQYLSRESLCVLASINMGKFSADEIEYKKEVSIIGESINRFLDNVNECELVYKTYATPHQRLAIEKLRRTGAGITNIGGWLFKSNLEYGSQEANKKIENFLDEYNYILYKSSESLGKEKSSFGLFNKDKFLLSPFIKRLQKSHQDLKFDHMRNVTCSSIAPTGTLTLMFREMLMSYGIEPAFGIYYWKRTRMSGKYEYYFIVPKIVRDSFARAGIPLNMQSDTIRDTWDGIHGKPIADFIDKNKNKLGLHFKNATEVSPFDKLDMMSKAMKHVDSSISVTYLLPETTHWKDVYNFILEAHKKEVKSIAAFPDKKMYGIVSFIPFKELALKLKSENIEIHPQNFSVEEQIELNISNDFIKMSEAPHRPKLLEADIHSVTVKGQKFVIAIGLLNGAPYEMFAGHMNGLNFKFQYKKGTIDKISKGKYRLEIGEDISIDDFAQQFTPVEQILCRLVSTSLRHGVPLKFIVEQLGKAEEDITSLSAASARVLKKYIQNGEKVTGMACPQCGNTELVYANGCVECGSCSWSKCA